MATAKSWGVEEVSGWLAEVGFPQLIDGFREQEVDGEVLLQLTTEDLKDEFRMKLGERKKLIERIENLKEKDASSSVIPTESHSDSTIVADDLKESIAAHFFRVGLKSREEAVDVQLAELAGESFDRPNLSKLMTALNWHQEHRPDWKVLTFVYEALFEQWVSEYPDETRDLVERFTITPRREDVDKFIIRKAVDEAKKGHLVKIVSNDNFREYIGEVNDFHFSEDWVREHVIKFCFAGADEFIPADLGEAWPTEIAAPETAPEVPRTVVAETAPSGLQILFTGRGAKFPSSLQIAEGGEEARCPHKRCSLRMDIVKQSSTRYANRITGLEAPPSRAERPIVEISSKRKVSRSWCPTCAKPLEFRNESTEAHTVQRRRGQGYAFVAVLFGPDQDMLQRFILGALVLGHSLKASGTTFDLVLLHTSDVMDVPGAGLLEVFWKTREVDYVEVDPKLIRGSEDRFRHVFTKLHCFSCDEYEKVILLDVDLLVRDNIDEMKEFRAPCALRRGHKSLPSHVDPALACYDRHGRQKFGMNLGVAVLKPSREELQKMLTSVQSRDPMHEVCNGPEQDFLSRWLKNWTTMNLKYNYQLHQLARSLEHAGSEAERLQINFEMVKVVHYSGKVKPWDFYFEGSEKSFDAFCDEKLLPAYMAKGEDFEEKIQRAAQEWKEQCKAMWQHVLSQTGSTCKLCGDAVSESSQLEHHFVLCPAISDLRRGEAALTLEEIQYPEPNEFARTLAFVASVLERQRWQADFEGSADMEGPREPQQKNEDTVAPVGSILEHQQQEPIPPTTSGLSQSTQVTTLHLVLQPQPNVPRPYDNSPLGQLRDKILGEVAANRVTIIVAPTGCGKSTRIPQMILDENPAERYVLVTQPRRVAATSLARRVASDRGVTLGTEVGYKIGGCSEVSRSGRTRLIYATTAIAMIQCLQDCSSFTHLIIDEVHIRDAHIDFLLSLVVTRVLAQNKKVKVILMSAAMDSDKIARYFSHVLEGSIPRPLDLEQCRQFKLSIRYLDDIPFFQSRGINRRGTDGAWDVLGMPADWSQEEVADLYAEFIQSCHQERLKVRDMASFLVFLPGKRELQLLWERLDEVSSIKVKCIFGGQTIEEQERVLAESQAPNERTVILGTDVVESSVTIPDVDLVIDTCEQKRLRWDGGKNQSLLTLILVSKDEAKQRSGRTGRVRDGQVVRLISKDCFDRLQAHAEPQIKHSRLEDLLLSLFELPNLGDPREFLQKMPDAPDKTRVDQAITRLLELNALAKQKGQTQPRPTFFGRFLQKMPLDPDVGFLVMSGVRLQLVQECCILAAVHQRGDPFMDSMSLSPAEVKGLWEVRDACSPGRAKGRDRPLPGDLMAGLGAYKAWQAQVKIQSCRGWVWDVREEARWCAEHFLSLERLHELEEMVVQIRDVLEELGYALSLPQADKERMRQRRQDKASATTAKVSPRVDAARDLWPLLHDQRNRDIELLLAWCIAASFTSGLIEVKNGSSTEQLKYKAKKHRAHQVGEVLRQQGFRVVDARTLQKGDVQVSFQNPEEAHKAHQISALLNNNMMPWKAADPWGRPSQRTALIPRQCYQGSPIKILPSSEAWLPTTEDGVLVAGDVLPIMNHKRTSMTYFCTKCSTVPLGIIPFILCATYPAARVDKKVGIWTIVTMIHGQRQDEKFSAPSQKVEEMLDNIRKNMDTEFGLNEHDRQRIVQERRSNVLALMKLLDQPNMKPPMQSLEQKHVTAVRARVPNFADMDFSSLFDLLTNDLDNFRL